MFYSFFLILFTPIDLQCLRMCIIKIVLQKVPAEREWRRMPCVCESVCVREKELRNMEGPCREYF